MSNFAAPALTDEQSEMFEGMLQMAEFGQLVLMSGFYKGEPRALITGVWKGPDGSILMAPYGILVTNDMLDDLGDADGLAPDHTL